MDINKLKKDSAIESKNGISFLLAGMVVWGIIAIFHMQDFGIHTKNIYSLYATGLMFPLGVFFSVMLKVDWKAKTNPLGSLGLLLNVAQLLYFPLLAWAWMENPADVMVVFAIITGAHLFAYGWLYATNIYYLMSPVMVVSLFAVGQTLNGEHLWVIPTVMCLLLLLFIGLLWRDYHKKVSDAVEIVEKGC